MIIFIYGDNSFAIRSRLQKIEEDFLKLDNAGMNIQKIEGADLTLGQFDQAVSTAPFLAPKRLVIIKNLLKDNKDNELKNAVSAKLAGIKSNEICDLVFVEGGEPDKRLKLFKNLTKIANVEIAAIPQGAELRRWVADQFSANHISIQPADADHLISEAGNDPQKLKLEIDKICLYARSRHRGQVLRTDIDSLVCSEVDPNIFHFTEAVTRKDSKTASKLLFEFINQGESEQKILGILYYQFRTLIIIKDALNRNMNGPEITRAAKLSPYVVNKNISIARAKSLKFFITVYDNLRRTDSAIKNGDVPPDMAIDLLIATLCS